MDPRPEPTGGEESPLSAEQLAAFADATERSRKILAAARVATFNGWTFGISAAVSALFALGSFTAFVLAIGLGIVTWNEFRGRTLLRRFDPDGARLLGRNQLGLMALIVLYCLWSIHVSRTTPMAAQFEDLEVALGDMSEVVAQLTLAVYGGVIAGTVLFQGLNAKYYFARVGMIEAYRRETPEWVLKLQESAG
jgi:hypothetical protein